MCVVCQLFGTYIELYDIMLMDTLCVCAGAGGPPLRETVDSEPPVSAEEFAPAVDVRTYFPETWLWSLNLVG